MKSGIVAVKSRNGSNTGKVVVVVVVAGASCSSSSSKSNNRRRISIYNVWGIYFFRTIATQKFVKESYDRMNHNNNNNNVRRRRKEYRVRKGFFRC